MDAGGSGSTEALWRKDVVPFCIKTRKCMHEAWFHQDLDVIQTPFIFPVIILVASKESHVSISVLHAGEEEGGEKELLFITRILQTAFKEEWSSLSRPYTPYPQPCLEAREGCRLTIRAHWKSELQLLAKKKKRWTHSSSPHLLSPWSSFLCDLSDSRSCIWHNWRCCKFQLVPSIQFLSLQREQRACSMFPQSVSCGHR